MSIYRERHLGCNILKGNNLECQSYENVLTVLKLAKCQFDIEFM